MDFSVPGWTHHLLLEIRYELIRARDSTTKGVVDGGYFIFYIFLRNYL